MLVADAGVMIVMGVFLIGLVGFFFMAIALAFRLLGYVFRSLVGGGREARPVVRRSEREGPICTTPRCGHVNAEGARFCARCGGPLGPHDDVDAYG